LAKTTETTQVRAQATFVDADHHRMRSTDMSHQNGHIKSEKKENANAHTFERLHFSVYN